jgi:hypothetical protein
MDRNLSLLALALWLSSLACPVIYDLDADQPRYYVLLMSFWGALYLLTLPWVFLNLAFFVLLRNNLISKPSRELVEMFFFMLGLVTLIEIGAEMFARGTGIEPLGIWRYGAIFWTLAMALMGCVGLRVEAKGGDRRAIDEQRPPNKALHRSAGRAVLIPTSMPSPAPGKRRR